MQILGWAILVIFFLILSLIAAYCILQFYLSWRYLQKPKKMIVPEIAEWPKVCIQLPVYNELHVIERLIDAVCKIDYPKELFEIQILDDSNDVTTDIAVKKAAVYRDLGFCIEVIRRKERTGFKAGALDFGLTKTKAELIAIFDADFIPSTDFLKKSIPHFVDNKIGVVQTRWGHINKNYNLITRLQAFQLNVHFSVEQSGRYFGGHFLQFNGTAGIWRREAIADGGGWSADTLTEDLDLSYRAQLVGWKFKYIEEVESPAELPADMNSFKAQQYRWMKGGAETAIKILPRLLRSDAAFSNKLHGIAHLLGSSVFLLVLLAGLLSWPAIFFMNNFGLNSLWMTVFFAGLLSLVIVYFIGNIKSIASSDSASRLTFIEFSGLFVMFLSLSMGMSLHNSIAVIQGYSGKRTPFVRTPKLALGKTGDKLVKSQYVVGKIPSGTLFELILAIYFTAAAIWGMRIEESSLLIYHLLLAAGFGTIGILSIRDYLWQSRTIKE